MSTPSNTPPAPTAGAKSASTSGPSPTTILIYGHTSLFYWWPVWALGFLFAAISFFGEGRAAVVHRDATYNAEKNSIELPPEKGKLLVGGVVDTDGKLLERMYPNKNLGVIFVIVLIIVTFITNVPLRGMSSAVAISTILVVTFFFALMGWWDNIFAWFGSLSIHMNAGFYFFFSTVLFVIWAAVFWGYDRLHFWRVTPGQITHEFAMGGGQTSFDTEGIVLKKYRDDLFRHWILGMGSGDLVMQPLQNTAANRDDLSIHNVLFIGHKLHEVQKLISPKG
jgi:hypothetical protein